MAQPTDREIAELAHRLAKLLEDDEGRGMASWEMARAHVGRQLHRALGVVLGEPSGVQIGDGNTQTNTFN